MYKIQVLPAVEDEFEYPEGLCESQSPEMPDISTSDGGELQPLPRTNQRNRPIDDTTLSEWASWRQFLTLLLRTGGWTVAVLLALRLILMPLLTAGNTPVAVILAAAVGFFLIICGIGALVRELKR